MHFSLIVSFHHWETLSINITQTNGNAVPKVKCVTKVRLAVADGADFDLSITVFVEKPSDQKCPWERGDRSSAQKG